MRYIGTAKIETKRLTLRRFAVDDAEGCCKNWAAAEEVYTHISEQPKSLEEMRTYLSSVAEAYERPDTYCWAIELKESQQVIGEIFVDDFGSRNRWCEVDYKIGPNFQGNGYATESLRAVLDFLFHSAGAEQIYAFPLSRLCRPARPVRQNPS